jgi:glycosyltransferase involved in cell wall biosynthesis
VSFELRVCGAGALEAGLRRELAARKLEGLVRLMGTLDFELALQPMTREWADLFICPHVQGDPSCTYLETLACGVPIAGYANEAWRGLLALGNVGVASRVGARAELAAQVARLADDRARLAELSRNARRFAAPHTFERTFQSRVQHLLMVAGIESGDPQREAGAA